MISDLKKSKCIIKGVKKLEVLQVYLQNFTKNFFIIREIREYAVFHQN